MHEYLRTFRTVIGFDHVTAALCRIGALPETTTKVLLCLLLSLITIDMVRAESTSIDGAAAYYFDQSDNLVAIEGRDFVARQIEVDSNTDGLDLLLKGVKNSSPWFFQDGPGLDVVENLKAKKVVYMALIGGNQLTVLGVESLACFRKGDRVIEGLTSQQGPICCCSLVPGPHGPVCPCPGRKC